MLHTTEVDRAHELDISLVASHRESSQRVDLTRSTHRDDALTLNRMRALKLEYEHTALNMQHRTHAIQLDCTSHRAHTSHDSADLTRGTRRTEDTQLHNSDETNSTQRTADTQKH